MSIEGFLFGVRTPAITGPKVALHAWLATVLDNVSSASVHPDMRINLPLTPEILDAAVREASAESLGCGMEGKSSMLTVAEEFV